MIPVSQGKPYAGNPHVRFEEGASAQAAPRRSALLNRVFSRMSRNVKNFGLDKRLMPIQDTYEPVSISFGFKNGMPLGQIGEYKPEPTAYFPVRVCYGSKEFCCSNHKEVEASLKTMINDSMHQILKRIDSEKDSKQKTGQ